MFRQTYPPSCTPAVARVLPEGRAIDACTVHVCLGDSRNREGRPVQLQSVKLALQHLCRRGEALREGRSYRRTMACDLSRIR